MKKTTKIVISFAVAIAIAATVLIVAVFKKDDSNLQPSVVYTLQPTVATNPANTNAWINPNEVLSDLASDTDVAYTATTMMPNAVTVMGTNGVTQLIYVDQFGNVVNPSNINPNGGVPGAPTPNNQPTGEVMDDAKLPGTTEEATVGFSEFEVNSNGVLTKYNGSDTFVMIPQNVNGVNVTAIGDACFANSGIKSVYIHAGITSIGARAFENCAYLGTVSFVDAKAKVIIGDFAFQNCPSLSSIHLPAVKVGMSAFGNCTALSSVIFASGSEKIGAYCFTNCKALSSVTIPESVAAEGLGQDIFNGCDYGKLTIITPDGSDAQTYAHNRGIMTRVP